MTLRAFLPAATGAVIPHSRPCLGPQEEKAAIRALRSGALAPGPEAARLERQIARLAGAADAVAVASGTAALTLALRALELGPGDEVAIPSFTCAALLHAVRAAGAAPLVCDIDPETLALDPEDLERRATPRLRGAIVVHPFGLPARMEAFRGRGLALIEDCAQALGATEGGRPVGSRGDAAIFSFAPTKVLTCGGPGGALASPRDAVVREARDLAGHDEKEIDRLRMNGLMGDLHAAIAAAQLARLREICDRRARIAARYDEAFASLPAERPRPSRDAQPVHYRYLIRLSGAERFLKRLNGRGVMARRPVYLPLHRLLGLPERFPATAAAFAGLVSLPISPVLTEAEVDRVIDEVRWCLS